MLDSLKIHMTSKEGRHTLFSSIYVYNKESKMLCFSHDF